MLLFPDNSFIASAFFSVYLRLWGFPFAKSFEESFCQAAVADPIKNGGPSIFLQKILLNQYFNSLI